MLSIEKQIFLQQMLSKDYLPFNEAIQLINKIVTELNRETNDPPCSKIGVRDMKSIIKEINNCIKLESIQLTITTCEATGIKHLTLHSIGHTDITELQTFYTPQELAYWLPLMEAIIKSETKSLNRISCLNLVAEHLLQISVEDADKFLTKCIKKGYLVIDNELYYLGSKAMCEFNKDLRGTYEEYIQTCELCSEICCYGKSCTNCDKLMHAYCLQAALKSKNECPLCHVQWGQFDFECDVQDVIVEEAEINNDQDTAMDTSPELQQPVRRSQRKRN